MKTGLRLSLLILAVGTGLFFCSHYLMELTSTKSLSQVILKHRLALGLWRYSFYALVLIVWPYFIEKIGRRQKWPVDAIVYLSKQRFKLVGLIVLIEIFFV